MLVGEKKKEYQIGYMKEYMRNRRLGLNKKVVGLNENNAGLNKVLTSIESQSYNPMMVGYEPKY
jgi:hypothetical protein